VPRVLAVWPINSPALLLVSVLLTRLSVPLVLGPVMLFSMTLKPTAELLSARFPTLSRAPSPTVTLLKVLIVRLLRLVHVEPSPDRVTLLDEVNPEVEPTSPTAFCTRAPDVIASEPVLKSPTRRSPVMSQAAVDPSTTARPTVLVCTPIEPALLVMLPPSTDR
jgi:hypothetical protein